MIRLFFVVSLITFLEAKSENKKLVLHAQHGPSNRLRVILSAYDQAKKSGRALKIIWEKDQHVDCVLPKLFTLDFDIPFEVTDKFDVTVYDPTSFDVYDYMNPTQKYKSIDYDSPRDIYVRTAYRLNSTYKNEREENAEFRRLMPNPLSARLIANMRRQLGRQYVGVHIRNLSPRTEVGDLPEDTYPASSWVEMEKFRSYCNVTTFARRISELEGEGESKFYVAADVVENIIELQGLVNSRFVWLDNKGCAGRGCKCLQYAIADFFMLVSSKRILGSYWSSFTELAAAFADVPVEFAGHDFK